MTKIEVVIIGLIVIVLGLFVLTMYDRSQSQPIRLNTNEWVCSRTEVITYMQPTQTGKITTIVPITSTECVSYERRR